VSTDIPRQDHRRAAAVRSIEAILDAAEQLLAGGSDASTSAVAAAAGVSRVTLYSHFPMRTAMLEAVAERVVARASRSIDAAQLQDGPPDAALNRLIETAWGKIDPSRTLIASARSQISHAAVMRAHRQIDDPILALIERGRRVGVFRTDVPSAWLLATYYALMHAAADEVTASRLGPDEALSAVKTTIARAFNNPS
jgi:TetR/AcrR family transcriptional regulator, mexCD-oprJ operon repressor